MQYIIVVLTKMSIYPQRESQGHSHNFGIQTSPWFNNHVPKDQ